MPRIAVVDIGSNSTRLLVADVEDGRVVAERERRSEVTRLAQGVDATGELAGEAMGRVRAVLDEYARQIERHGADRRVAVFTSAVRDASNGEAFVASIRDGYGLEAAVLAGSEEARLTFLGATSERDPGDTTPTVVVDIGGGSTELIAGEAHEVRFAVSTQAGVVRQTERHLHDDPPPADQRAELIAEVEALFAREVPREIRAGAEALVAVAGTATSLAAIDLELEPYDPERVHGHVLARTRIRELLERLAALPEPERREVAGLHPQRAATIVAGALILLAVLDAFGLDRMEVSEHDILRGVALDRAALDGRGA